MKKPAPRYLRIYKRSMSATHKRFLWLATLSLMFASVALFALELRAPVAQALQWHILVQLQLPLWLTAITVGAALTTSAACLQVVLRNPLADPGMIGISSGASLVAAAMILLAPPMVTAYMHYWLPLACFLGALLSTLFIYLLAQRLGNRITGVILAGIAIATMSSAIIGWLYWFSDAHAMRQLTFWLMGSLYQSDWLILSVAAPVMLVAMAILWSAGAQLNLLYGGELNAQMAGLNVSRLTTQTLLCSAVAVGCAVAIAGSIAFLGILVPHVLRLRYGHDNRFILPAAALVGALLLVLIALVTEAWGKVTLPVSMITATLGGPLLLWVIFRGRYL